MRTSSAACTPVRPALSWVPCLARWGGWACVSEWSVRSVRLARRCALASSRPSSSEGDAQQWREETKGRQGMALERGTTPTPFVRFAPSSVSVRVREACQGQREREREREREWSCLATAGGIAKHGRALPRKAPQRGVLARPADSNSPLWTHKLRGGGSPGGGQDAVHLVAQRRVVELAVRVQHRVQLARLRERCARGGGGETRVSTSTHGSYARFAIRCITHTMGLRAPVRQLGSRNFKRQGGEARGGVYPPRCLHTSSGPWARR
jgi:hypothetical protein